MILVAVASYSDNQWPLHLGNTAVSGAASEPLQSVVVLKSLCVSERRLKEVKQVWTEEGGGQVQFFKVITGKTRTFSHDAVPVLVQSDVCEAV